MNVVHLRKIASPNGILLINDFLQPFWYKQSVFVNTQFLRGTAVWPGASCVQKPAAPKRGGRETRRMRRSKKIRHDGAPAIDEWNKALIFCQYILLLLIVYALFSGAPVIFSHHTAQLFGLCCPVRFLRALYQSGDKQRERGRGFRPHGVWRRRIIDSRAISHLLHSKQILNVLGSRETKQTSVEINFTALASPNRGTVTCCVFLPRGPPGVSLRF